MNEAKNFKLLSMTPEAVYQLAADIDQFWNFESGNDVRNVKRIAHFINIGRTYYLKIGLQAFIDGNRDRDPEQTKTAESLLRRLNLIQRNH